MARAAGFVSTVFEMLKEDHDKVKKLFEDFESAEGRERGEIAKTAIQELEIHADLEERLIYPAIRAEVDAADMMNEAIEEHHLVHVLIAELKKLKKGTYAHKHPNRRVRRHFLRHPPKPVKPVDAGDKLPVSGGHDPGAAGPVAGRESTGVGKQTALALSAVYGFFSRVGHLLDFRRWRVWAVAVGAVRRLFGRA